MNDMFWTFFFFGARLLIFALAVFALIDIMIAK